MADDERSDDSHDPERTEVGPRDERNDGPGRGEQIGAYRLLRKIGEGGMGEVWLAEQQPVHREVALKVIKQGMDTRQVVARFEAERQALAMMDHPCIARVYEAGATPRGRPYFVMEYVKGVPITEHCDRQKLSTRRRLELFQRVCAGVQHAHQKAVIHRDLKPSNVMVSIEDGKAVPKIIDFGVAKATAQKLTERTMFTELGMLVGTPEYMSPEQAEMTGQDVDTRTDVYSLGVMLYELLVGALPFDPKELRESGYDGIVRKIREEEPSKPSTRLATLGGRSAEFARQRETDVTALCRELSGDLDWIVMRALEKDRTRRYGAPSDLASDIDRYLIDQPVVARPPSVSYRAGKFIRRHRLGVTAASLVALGLALGTVGTTVGLVQARRAEARATHEAAAKGQVLDFLKGVFTVTDPSEALGNSVTARELLDEGARRIDEVLFDQPELRAELMATMGVVYLNLGVFSQAAPLLEHALETNRRSLGDEHAETLRAMSNLANLYRAQGRYADAEPLLLATLEARRRVLGDEHPDTLDSMNSLAFLNWSQGRYGDAEQLYLESLEARKRVLGNDHPDTLMLRNNLALVYREQARYAEAEPLYVETLGARRRVLGEDHPQTLISMNNLAGLYRNQARFDEAEALYEEAVETARQVLGEEHPHTLLSQNNLAVLYKNQVRYDEAEALLFRTLETQQRVLGDDHPNTIRSVANLAALYGTLGRYADAEPLYVEALERRTRVLGEHHPLTLASMNDLALLHWRLGRYADAESLLLECLRIRKSVMGDQHPQTLNTMGNLALLNSARGNLDEAERLYLEALEIEKRIQGADHPHTLTTINNLAVLYKKQGRLDRAEPLYLETLESRKRALEKDHPDTLRSMNNLAELYQIQGRLDEAEPLYLEALEAKRRVLGEDHADTASTTHNLACLYRDTGRYEKSREFFETTLRLDEAALGADHPYVAEDLVEFAKLLRLTGDDTEAARLEAHAAAIQEK